MVRMKIHDSQYLKMAAQEPSGSITGKRIRQSISVPFCWEEKPGQPKRNWKPTTPQQKQTAPPAKLIASIPFLWEEKPGTPLPCFLEPLSSSMLALPAPGQDMFIVSSPCYPPVSETSWGDINGRDGYETEIYEPYSGLSGTETDDSFTSANSLLANGLIPTVTLASAVPWQPQNDEPLKDAHEESLPASPASESESNASTYATGTTSLAGANLLQWLFPLLSHQPTLLGKAGCSETAVSNAQITNSNNNVQLEKKQNGSVKRTLTLGELIMMSRRQSYYRKANKFQTQNFSQGTAKWSAFGRCIFQTSNILRKLHMNWKKQLQLKLM